MTNTDIRDIAAYYGAACSYVTTYRDVAFDARNRPLDHNVLGGLSMNPQWTDFRVHLRPLSALTDEQLVTLFETAFGVVPVGFEIERSDWRLRVNCAESRQILTIYTDGKTESSVYAGYHSNDLSRQANIFALTRQLQAWGYYVKGTIDEKYVKLIEN